MNNYPGKLIVLYGINNLGKSTQAKLLVEKLKTEGFQAEYLKYPIYNLNPSGEIINDYLREGNFYNLHSREAQILYVLNRTQYQDTLISKLKAGIHIIAEDYKGTGIAWGLGSGISEVFLKSINSHLIDEDLVFLFDGERFTSAVEKNHKHETNNDLTNKVRWAHLKLKEEYGWIKINANLKIEEIQDIIWKKVSHFIETGVKTEDKTDKKPSYNYSGLKSVAEIMNNNHQAILDKLAKEIENSNTKELNKEDDSKIIKIEELGKELEKELKEDKTSEIEKLIKPEVLELKVEKIKNNAKLPEKAHLSDAGFDLFSTDYYSIPPYSQALVETGIKIELPRNYAGFIWDKSGLANEGITTMGGVIDNDYRGEIKVIIKNLSEDIFNIVPGQKVAQIILQEIPQVKIKEEKINNNSLRGDNGFGSSGKF